MIKGIWALIVLFASAFSCIALFGYGAISFAAAIDSEYPEILSVIGALMWLGAFALGHVALNIISSENKE